MFNKLYLLKKRSLQLECLKGNNSFSEKKLAAFKAIYGEPQNMSELSFQIDEFTTRFLEPAIPRDVMEDWEYCDYTVYTDAHHHRKFWNEIGNDACTDYFLELFCQIANLVIEDTDEMKYLLCVYDLNDFEFFFRTNDEMVAFFETYAIAPVTCFEKNEEGAFVETWSA